MATTSNSNILSSDIYDISEFVNTIQQNNSDLDESTLALGIFGYMNDMFTINMQNTVRMTAEYSNEAIATRAKYAKNVITHALNLGITDINAIPSYIKTLILIPEDELLLRMENNKFTLYSDCKIYIGNFEFHYDYDIIIKKNILANQSAVYTATYNMDIENDLSDITNPYLPPIGIYNYYGGRMLALAVTLRQVEYRTITKKIIIDNPLENKVMNFSFNNQLATFNLDVNEIDGHTEYLVPVYDGLYDETPGLSYCNYSYLNSNTIRVKFNRDSYEPKLNCDVNINIRETQGSAGNFKFVNDIQVDLNSEKYNYNGMYVIVQPIGDQEAIGGLDKKSVEQLKKIIPKEALAHGTIINTQDLTNFFNQIDDDNCTLYFYKNKDNPLTRLYYGYIVTKQNNNVIPTNTIDFAFTKDQFTDSINKTNGNIVMEPGQLFYLNPGDNYTTRITELDENGLVLLNSMKNYLNDIVNFIEVSNKEFLPTIKPISTKPIIYITSDKNELYDWQNDQLVNITTNSALDKYGFLYMNPFLCIINRSPLYTSYILDIFSVEKDLEFTYINSNSEFQYISSTVSWYRQYFTDRNKYKMDIQVLQNINSEQSGIFIKDGNNIIGAKLKIILVFYDSQGIRPFRWIEAKYKNFDSSSYVLDYQFELETDNTYDASNRIKIINMHDANPNLQFEKNSDNSFKLDDNGNKMYEKSIGYNKEKVKSKILMFAEFKEEFGRKSKSTEWDRWIPGLEGYTLTNEYDITDNLELFYNYSQIMTSDIKLTQYDPNTKPELTDTTYYSVLRMPCIRALYIKNEKRISTFIKEVEKRRKYIEQAVLKLEDSFGIDFKFFNTYGPSKIFYLEDSTNISRTNLSMTFKLKPYSSSDAYIKDNIIADIKEYLEDINTINDFHAPNLTTYIENKYKDQLIYFEFVDINGFGPGEQHIYMPEQYSGDVVPEFLNINITEDNEPDITINVISTST